MTHRWLGWLASVVLATAAHAENRAGEPVAAQPGDPAQPAAIDTRPAAAGRPGELAQPAAIDARPIAHRPYIDPSREPRGARDAGPGELAGGAAVAVTSAAIQLGAAELAQQAGDPVLGRADRIDGDERKGMVAFTFDDGPSAELTPVVLAALEKYDVPAAFFVVGTRLTGRHAERGRDLLFRQLSAGFLVGSHTASHESLKRASPDKLTREIDGSVKLLAITAGRPIGLFRAPYGVLGKAGKDRVKRLGLTEVRWSVDTRDWKADDPGVLRAQILEMIKRNDGGVVLMHDVKSITASVLADVLDDLEAENCARLGDGRAPILPVSLHYFLEDGSASRALPDAVVQRTAAYRQALPERCARRNPAATSEVTPI